MNSSRAIPLIFLNVAIFMMVLITIDQKRQVSANKGGSDIILYKNNLVVRSNNKGKGNKGKGGSIIIVNGGHKHHGNHGYGGHEHHGHHHGHHKISFEQNLIMNASGSGGKGLQGAKNGGEALPGAAEGSEEKP